tara:strand:- start:100 stop:489 length:390 start_codon:yes stop_codon:yes gene_type:complete
MKSTNTKYKLNCKSFTKQNYSIKYNSDFIIDKLALDFSNMLVRLIPKKLAIKATKHSKIIFNYFNCNKIEEIFLLINKNQHEWQMLFSVCPSYKNDEENLLNIEKYLKNKTMIFSMKNFYTDNLKKYIN